jgi:hypothetical protein
MVVKLGSSLLHCCQTSWMSSGTGSFQSTLLSHILCWRRTFILKTTDENHPKASKTFVMSDTTILLLRCQWGTSWWLWCGIDPYTHSIRDQESWWTHWSRRYFEWWKYLWDLLGCFVWPKDHSSSIFWVRTGPEQANTRWCGHVGARSIRATKGRMNFLSAASYFKSQLTFMSQFLANY